jgi:hypothetical protein
MIKRKVNDIEFEILSPNEKLNGNTYGEFLAESWKKLLSDDPDRSDGVRYFVRTSPNPQEIPFQKSAQLFSDQAVFVPIITAAINTNDSSEFDTESKRRAAANSQIDAGDNPPQANQVTIDGKPIVDDLKDFRVESPEFDLAVHDNSSVKHKLEVPHEAGNFPTVAAGYCVIVKSLPAREKPYNIRIKAKGEGNYYTEANYDLQVIDRK